MKIDTIECAVEMLCGKAEKKSVGSEPGNRRKDKLNLYNPTPTNHPQPSTALTLIVFVNPIVHRSPVFVAHHGLLFPSFVLSVAVIFTL